MKKNVENSDNVKCKKEGNIFYGIFAIIDG